MLFFPLYPIHSFPLVADAAFPRSQVIRGLLHAMRTQPKLSKESSSALIDLGEAISGNATSEETTLLIESTLVQEAYARNASLQALQVIPLPEQNNVITV
jgi:hypothetical protein